MNIEQDKIKPKKTIVESGAIDNLFDANTYKIEIKDGTFIIDFGKWIDKDHVEVLSRINLDDAQIFNFIMSLMDAAEKYDEMFDKNIFPDGWDECDEFDISEGDE